MTATPANNTRNHNSGSINSPADGTAISDYTHSHKSLHASDWSAPQILLSHKSSPGAIEYPHDSVMKDTNDSYRHGADLVTGGWSIDTVNDGVNINQPLRSPAMFHHQFPQHQSQQQQQRHDYNPQQQYPNNYPQQQHQQFRHHHNNYRNFNGDDRRHQSTQTDTSRNTSRPRNSAQQRQQRTAGTTTRSLSSSASRGVAVEKSHNRFPSTGTCHSTNYSRHQHHHHHHHHQRYPQHSFTHGKHSARGHSRRSSGPVIRDEDFPDIISISTPLLLQSPSASFEPPIKQRPMWTAIVKDSERNFSSNPPTVDCQQPQQQSHRQQLYSTKKRNPPIVARYRSKSFDGNHPPATSGNAEQMEQQSVERLQHSLSQLNLLKPAYGCSAYGDQQQPQQQPPTRYRILSRNADGSPRPITSDLPKSQISFTSTTQTPLQPNAKEFIAAPTSSLQSRPATSDNESAIRADNNSLMTVKSSRRLSDPQLQPMLSADTPAFILPQPPYYDDISPSSYGYYQHSMGKPPTVQYSSVSTSTTMDDPILIPLSDEDDDEDDGDWTRQSARRLNSIYEHGLVLSETLPRRFST